MFFLMFLLLMKTTYFSDACVFVQVVFFFNLFKMNCSLYSVFQCLCIYVCVCFRASSSASTLIPLGIYLEPTLKLVSFYDFYINLSSVELCCCGIE